ncbi:MAG: formylmethanofuran dehydrogenase subunit C [Chromatiales bacterium]
MTAPLTLTLRSRPQQPVDLAPVIPDRLQGMTMAAIRAMKLDAGKARMTVDELFRVSGKDPAHVVIHKSCNRLYNVGASMMSGTIEVHGPVGDYLGTGMRGGKIVVRGHAGASAGTGMRGGLIEIRGNAGDRVGAARAGDTHGMNDGTILVIGNAGARLGDRMRRGAIIVKGDAGDYCGARMSGGTVLVLGAVGKFTGLGMHRGTIVLGRRPKERHACFNKCGTLKMQFLRILFRHLARSHRTLAGLKRHGPLCDRYSGDMAAGGKGEIMVLRTGYSY